IWPLLTDERGRRAVEVAERYADGAVGERDLSVAQGPALGREEAGWPAMAAWCAADYSSDTYLYAASSAAACARDALAGGRVRHPNPDEEQKEQVVIVGCIFGNPFRPVNLSPAWQTPTVVPLAQAAYDYRDLPSGRLESSRLAVLADALEDAGCTNPDIL